jgi:GMP synthase (glutamine-hydrolysing)
MLRSSNADVSTLARPARRYVLIIQHVAWEGPGLIAEVLTGLPTRTVMVAEKSEAELPDPDELAALVAMGGPMNADDLEHYPGLKAERELLAKAIEVDVPTVGVCLGAQLLARALGATVVRGTPELGWAPVRIHDPSDPIVGSLRDGAPVLHWHSDACALPSGATLLASTRATPVQAFRAGSAWGLQFHLEATRSVITRWLATPAMAREALEILGPEWHQRLEDQTAEALPRLAPAARGALQTFADLARARAQK